MLGFWKSRDGYEWRGSRSACFTPGTRVPEAPALYTGRRPAARVKRQIWIVRLRSHVRSASFRPDTAFIAYKRGETLNLATGQTRSIHKSRPDLRPKRFPRASVYYPDTQATTQAEHSI